MKYDKRMNERFDRGRREPYHPERCHPERSEGSSLRSFFAGMFILGVTARFFTALRMRDRAVRTASLPAGNGGLPCILLGTLLLAGCTRQVEPPLPMSVQTLTLQREIVQSETRFTATVREHERIQLSFKVPGTVTALRQVAGVDAVSRELHEGDEVIGGDTQPLARLEDSDYQRRVTAARDRLDQARAKQRATEATVTAVRASFKRMKALRERGSIAQQAFEDVLARHDASEAELEAAARDVSSATVAWQQAEDDLKHCALLLPVAKATISRKYVEHGERVQAGQPILEVMELASVRVAFGVPDTKVDQFRNGQTLAVMADAFPGQRFAGRVSKIQPAADPRTRSFELEVTIDEPRRLRPGMVVSLLTGREQRMVLLPMTAIGRGETPEETTVFAVADEDGRKVVHKRRVVLGGVYDNRIRLLEGTPSQVVEGDTIVANGAFRLSEGQEVRVFQSQEPAWRIGS
jgi:RND family efflux transporter MFP subunit